MTITQIPEQSLAGLIRDVAHPLLGNATQDYDPLLDLIGDKQIVLLGEATHGTHEFYAARADITRRLIEERGFAAIGLEADLPDVVSVDRHVSRPDSKIDLSEALARFRRFPMWMWRNSAFQDFIHWLWVHNRKESTLNRVRLFGIDLYCLFDSIREVVRYLEKTDPEAARAARSLYSCFDHNRQDPVRYGRDVHIGTHESCSEPSIKAAALLLAERMQGAFETGKTNADEHFLAKLNAELVTNAESYYRNLFSPNVNTWNVRDRHMADMIERWREHLTSQGYPNKFVIWAHNSHIGDDAATEMGWHGQKNIGQLIRERYPGQSVHVGFTTYDGTVTAAREWDQPPETRAVRPALPGSFESLFHETGLGAFFLRLHDSPIRKYLLEERLERAIGVVYNPELERASHYFQARLGEQFDAVLHFDSTREVEPLDRLTPTEVSRPSEIQI